MTSKNELVIKEENELVARSNSDKVLDGLIQSMASGAMSPESLEKILDMQERILNRQAEQDFNEAFKDLKSELSPVVNNAQSHTNKYSTIDHIQKTIASPMARHGFTINWDVTKDGETIVAKCFLSHCGGHKSFSNAFAVIESSSRATNKSQAIAIATTYAKRYSLLNVLGLTTTNEDTDGNYPDSHSPMSEDQISLIEKRVSEVGVDRIKFLKFYNVEKIGDLNSDQFTGVMKKLQLTADAKKAIA